MLCKTNTVFGCFQHATLSQEILAEATWRRRQRRLNKVEIPAPEVEIMEHELLGKGTGGGGGGSGLGPGGAFSTTAVYLADCNGLNAAVKVFAFKAGVQPSGGLDTRIRRSHRRGGGARAGCGFQKVVGGAAAAAAKNSLMHEEEEDIERAFAEAEADQDDGRRHAALVREVAAIKRLRHPRIVTVYGAVGGGGDDTGGRLSDGGAGGGGRGDGGGGRGPLWLAMELLPGGSLRQRLQRSAPGGTRRGQLLPLGWKAVRGIVKDVCAGMAFLHGEAFVHGGLSSTNVLLDARGRAKVTDWLCALSCVLRLSCMRGRFSDAD